MSLPVPSSQASPRRKLSIVMPSYNESANLPIVVPEVIATLQKGCSQGFELVVVDDGSTDDTQRVLSELAARHSELRVVTHAQNRGLTAALRTGFFAAEAEFVLFVPADGEFPAADILLFLDAAEGMDVVTSVYRKRPVGIDRIVMSQVLRLLLRVMIGFSDRLEGPYLFRRSLIDSIELVAERSAGSIGFELVAKARRAGANISTITVSMTPRLSGQSKVANARNIMQYLAEILRIRQSMRR